MKTLINIAFASLAAPSETQCSGWRIFKCGRLTVELWRCPKGRSIPPHSHPHIVSRFVFLNRNLRVHRRGSCKTAPLPWLRYYTVPPGQPHWAEALYGTGWFLNFEWWTASGDAQSAAADFERNVIL